jgi:hypothetical protein
MWTSTSKVIESNEVQKEKMQLDLDFPKSITTSTHVLVCCGRVAQRSRLHPPDRATCVARCMHDCTPLYFLCAPLAACPRRLLSRAVRPSMLGGVLNNHPLCFSFSMSVTTSTVPPCHGHQWLLSAYSLSPVIRPSAARLPPVYSTGAASTPARPPSSVLF